MALGILILSRKKRSLIGGSRVKPSERTVVQEGLHIKFQWTFEQVEERMLWASTTKIGREDYDSIDEKTPEQ